MSKLSKAYEESESTPRKDYNEIAAKEQQEAEVQFPAMTLQESIDDFLARPLDGYYGMPRDSAFGKHLKEQHDKHVKPHEQKIFDKIHDALLKYRDFREAHVEKALKAATTGKNLTDNEIKHLEEAIR